MCISEVVERFVELLPFDPLSEEVSRIFHVWYVGDGDLPRFDTLLDNLIAAEGVATASW